jgi:ABC-type uncharacterized transport system auxiliary subunit
MKKLFAILAVAGVLVACNDSGKQEEPKADTTNAAPAPAPDTTSAKVDTSAAKVDTSAAKADTSAAKH